MCVLATAGPAGPLATPVRYFHLGFTLMFTTAAGSPKLRTVAAGPRVSIGVFAPLVSQASNRGAQIFGRARVLTPADADRHGAKADGRCRNGVSRAGRGCPPDR